MSTFHNVIGQVGGFTKLVSAEVTRPANTDAYLAGDIVGDATSGILELAGAARRLPEDNMANGDNPASGHVVSALLTKSGSTVADATFRALLFREAPAAVVDNAALAFAWADRAKLLGYFDFETMALVDGGTGIAAAFNDDLRIPFTLAPTSQSLYVAIVAQAGYVPDSAEVFRIQLGLEQN